MGIKRIIILSFIVGLSGTSLLAQLRLPSMEVQVKSGVAALMEMSDTQYNMYNYTAPVIHGELNFNISQYFAAGAFFSKGFPSQSEYSASDNSGSSIYNSQHQLYGIKLRVSTGRQPRFRPFAELTYGYFEMYMDKGLYRDATSSTFIGWSIGLMIRLNSKLYLVLPQLSVRTRSDQFYWESPNDFVFSSYPSIIELTGGLSYNFGKKK
jgi:hypothetical protein